MADNSAFTKALHNFTMDASCGDAIRHLTDRGYTFDKIKEVQLVRAFLITDDIDIIQNGSYLLLAKAYL
ncbi:MAG: hypothetical protein IJI51_08200, partial [Lachnospiraceae bacterium]|nr:hypothetical protein [Lachnospiraceae bacterium]